MPHGIVSPHPPVGICITPSLSEVPSTSDREIAQTRSPLCRSRFYVAEEKRGERVPPRGVYDAGRACVSRRVRAFRQFRLISRTSFVSLSRGGPRHVSNDAVTIHLMARGPP